MSELKQVKVILGRFQPFTLGHLKIATYKDFQGPDQEQKDALREQPDLEEISKQSTVILSVLTPKDKVDTRHPFDTDLMKEELEIIKKNYKEIENILYVKSADICAWGELLKQNGYQASVWITGSDEFPMYKGMAIKVPEYEEHNRNNYDCKDAYTKSFYVEKVQRTENQNDFVSTISGTKVREALKNEDRDLFKKMMPDGIDILFNKFREALLNAPEPAPKKSSKKKIKECMDNLKPIKAYITEKLKIDKDSKIDDLDELVENIMLICAIKFENKWHPEIAANEESEFKDSLKTALNKYNVHKLEDFDLFTDYRGNITKLKDRYKELGIKENENYPIKVKDDCFDYISTRNQDVIFNEGGFYMSIVSSNSIFIQYKPNPSYGANYSILFKIKDK